MSYKFTEKKLPGSEIELSITVSPEEYEVYLEKAATKISNKAKIKGFRPGKAPYHIVKKEFGDMAILQEAIPYIVQHSYHSVVVENKLQIIGQPQIQMEKMAPGNDIVYKAKVALLPEVKVADISKIKIKKEIGKVQPKAIDEIMQTLLRMHAEEKSKSGKATKDDKLVIDMDMKMNNVPVEGGQAKAYQVYLSEEHYIPGFNKELIGLSSGDNKEFSLQFPSDHYQKQLAGKKVDFSVQVKEVYERILPEANDEFAKKLGQKDLAELRSLLTKNKEAEAAQKAEQKFEIEALEALIEKSSFGEIPQILIDSEKGKIFNELKADIEKHGLTMEQYLSDIKKTEEELAKDFAQEATKRAKAALLSRQIALNENIMVKDEELENEVMRIKEMYKDNPEYVVNLDRVEVRETIATTIQNRKVMEFIKEKIGGENAQKTSSKEKKIETKKPVEKFKKKAEKKK